MKIWKTIRELFGTEAAEAIEPKPGALNAAHATVERATAHISNAYGAAATAFAVRYGGEDFLVTSAHLTTNQHVDSRGFNYLGKQYFLVSKGKSLALAEHTALNPQGSPCYAVAGEYNPTQPFTDLSILKVMPQNQAIRILNEMSYDPSLLNALNKSVSRTPGLNAPALQRGNAGAQLTQFMPQFALKPLLLNASTANPENPAKAQLLGYHRNQPYPVSFAVDNHTRADDIVLRSMGNNPAIQGNSGALIYHVSAFGRVIPLGVMTGLDATPTLAHATPIRALHVGLDRVVRHQLIDAQKIREVCRNAVGGNDWFAAGVTADSAKQIPAEFFISPRYGTSPLRYPARER